MLRQRVVLACICNLLGSLPLGITMVIAREYKGMEWVRFPWVGGILEIVQHQ